MSDDHKPSGWWYALAVITASRRRNSVEQDRAEKSHSEWFNRTWPKLAIVFAVIAFVSLTVPLILIGIGMSRQEEKKRQQEAKDLPEKQRMIERYRVVRAKYIASIPNDESHKYSAEMDDIRAKYMDRWGSTSDLELPNEEEHWKARRAVDEVAEKAQRVEQDEQMKRIIEQNEKWRAYNEGRGPAQNSYQRHAPQLPIVHRNSGF